MKRAILSCAAMLMLTAGAGCGSTPSTIDKTSPITFNKDDRAFRDRNHGLGPISHGIMRNNTRNNDTFTGNRTPPFENVSNKHHSYGTDRNMIRYTVNNSGYFKPGMINMIGNNAYVYVTYTGDKAHYNKRVSRLKTQLQTQMPRYDIKLRVTNH